MTRTCGHCAQQWYCKTNDDDTLAESCARFLANTDAPATEVCEIWGCKELAAQIKQDAKERVRDETPKLLVITVGDDPASKVYVRNKKRDCEEIGFDFEQIIFDEDASTDDIVAAIEASDAHGIIMQLPVPDHIDVARVTAAIPAEKDVDCFKPENVGALVLGDPIMLPCTPAGVMAVLEHHGVELAGKDVTILGRSNIVGKPLANMMINAGATVTCCNSRSSKLTLADADIIVSAVGKIDMLPQYLKIKPDAIVIDVGINRDADGSLCGDVSKDTYRKYKAVTPVPGGIGLMTRAMLMQNVATAYLLQAEGEDR